MSKKKELCDAKIVFKKGAWSVSVDDTVIGRADSLMAATDLLYTHGYKVYCYRRGSTASGKMMFTTSCLKFDYNKENEDV